MRKMEKRRRDQGGKYRGKNRDDCREGRSHLGKAMHASAGWGNKKKKEHRKEKETLGLGTIAKIKNGGGKEGNRGGAKKRAGKAEH